jgi:pimeloyl-ACP methyl ester carboxylesterase
MSSSRVLAFCLALAWPVAGAEPLPVEERQRLDARAWEEPMPAELRPRSEFAQDSLAHLIAMMPLSETAVRQAADDEVLRLLAEPGERPVSPVLAGLFQRLADAVPPRPGSAPWRLLVTGSPDPAPSAPGGGIILIPPAGIPAEGDAGPVAAALLAREMGHDHLGHVRLARQAEAALRLAGSRVPDPTGRALVAASAGPLAKAVTRFVYGLAQECEADRFALQVLDRAGIDRDPFLDLLRRGSRDDATVRWRLKSILREERADFTDMGSFGLFRCVGSDAPTAPAATGSIAAGSRPLVVSHGLEGGWETCRHLCDLLRTDARFAGRPVLCFLWPNDRPLTGVGRFLRAEVARVVAQPQEAVFVAHSAGGLVLRSYAQREGGRLAGIVFVGTPHGGSDLAKAWFALELLQIVQDQVGDLRPALRIADHDGQGQIANDLRPGSLFLTGLAGAPAITAPVGNLRGRAFTPTRSLMIMTAMAGAQAVIRKRLETADLTVEARQAWAVVVSGLSLPPEVLHGDLAVSLDHAALPGAEDQILPFDHLTLMRDPAALRAIADRVAAIAP